MNWKYSISQNTYINFREIRREKVPFETSLPIFQSHFSVAVVRYQSFSISRRISSSKILSFILPLGIPVRRRRRRPGRREECEKIDRRRRRLAVIDCSRLPVVISFTSGHVRVT